MLLEPRYEIVAELGQGGMATVELARTVGAASFERLVVIKRLHPHLARDRAMVRRFVREARIASHLHHTNVVAIQHVGKDEHGYFLVFDYVEGDSLQGLIERAAKRGERVPSRVVLRVLLDALEGLHAAHDARDSSGRALEVLHRDATPQNILVGRDGVGRIADFGLSRASLSSSRTSPGVLMGKILYMAPEYIREDEIDRRIDVYAMGITAWVALTGKRPLSADSDAALLRLVLDQPIPSPREVAPELDPELAELILRACSKDPAERFATARAMGEAIEQLEGPRHGLASSSEVSEYIDHLLGDELNSRRSSLPPSSGVGLVELPRAGRIPRELLPVTGPVAPPTRAEAIGRPELGAWLRAAGTRTRRLATVAFAALMASLYLGAAADPRAARARATAAAAGPDAVNISVSVSAGVGAGIDPADTLNTIMQPAQTPAPPPAPPPPECPLPTPWCEEQPPQPEPLRGSTLVEGAGRARWPDANPPSF